MLDAATLPVAGIAPPFVIAPESPLKDDIRILIDELNATLHESTPPEFCYQLTVEEMAAPDMTVFVARKGPIAAGTGSIRRHPAGIGEIKRMYVRPEYQGQGIGGAILEEIEALAVAEGLERLVLETGHNHPAAWRVYERAGFLRCGPVLNYEESSYSIFYEKKLARSSGGGA
jgi:putative acetyltransferase